MNTKDLKYLIALADHGHFGKAEGQNRHRHKLTADIGKPGSCRRSGGRRAFFRSLSGPRLGLVPGSITAFSVPIESERRLYFFI